jgi:hypothetical protein
VEKFFPSLKTRDVKNKEGKIVGWRWGLSMSFYPYGSGYGVSDVPDEIHYKAAIEGERDYWGDMADAAKERYELEQFERMKK